MADKLIIGLTGHASSGKWTVGNLLRYKLNFRHVRFDDPARTMACQLANIDPWILHSMRHHPQPWLNDCSLQYLMDATLAGLRQAVGPSVLDTRVERILQEDYPRIVVSDIKTLRHAEIVKDHGGLIIRLRRSAEDLNRDFKPDYDVLPEKLIDATVMNTGNSIFPLKRQIVKAIKELL